MSMSKIYRGYRHPQGWVDQSTVCSIEEGDFKPLDPRYDLRNHSPAGFEWGYGGSGPAQLALAILADATGDAAYANANYQYFKKDVIEKLDGKKDLWISASTVLTWVKLRAVALGVKIE
jgi:hypothetical protein